jgi:hypothetical protein
MLHNNLWRIMNVWLDICVCGNKQLVISTSVIYRVWAGLFHMTPISGNITWTKITTSAPIYVIHLKLVLTYIVWPILKNIESASRGFNLHNLQSNKADCGHRKLGVLNTQLLPTSIYCCWPLFVVKCQANWGL